MAAPSFFADLALLSEPDLFAALHHWWKNGQDPQPQSWSIFLPDSPVYPPLSLAPLAEKAERLLREFRFGPHAIQRLGRKGYEEAFLNYLQRQRLQCEIEWFAPQPGQELCRLTGPAWHGRLLGAALLHLPDFDNRRASLHPSPPNPPITQLTNNPINQ